MDTDTKICWIDKIMNDWSPKQVQPHTHTYSASLIDHGVLRYCRHTLKRGNDLEK